MSASLAILMTCKPLPSSDLPRGGNEVSQVLVDAAEHLYLGERRLDLCELDGHGDDARVPFDIAVLQVLIANVGDVLGVLEALGHNAFLSYLGTNWFSVLSVVFPSRKDRNRQLPYLPFENYYILILSLDSALRRSSMESTQPEHFAAMRDERMARVSLAMASDIRILNHLRNRKSRQSALMIYEIEIHRSYGIAPISCIRNLYIQFICEPAIL